MKSNSSAKNYWATVVAEYGCANRIKWAYLDNRSTPSVQKKKNDLLVMNLDTWTHVHPDSLLKDIFSNGGSTTIKNTDFLATLGNASMKLIEMSSQILSGILRNFRNPVGCKCFALFFFWHTMDLKRSFPPIVWLCKHEMFVWIDAVSFLPLHEQCGVLREGFLIVLERNQECELSYYRESVHLLMSIGVQAVLLVWLSIIHFEILSSVFPFEVKFYVGNSQ